MEKKITGHTDFTLKCNRSRWKKNQIGKTWNKNCPIGLNFLLFLLSDSELQPVLTFPFFYYDSIWEFSVVPEDKQKSRYLGSL